MNSLLLLGWAGSILLAIGLYGIGSQRRGAFIFSILGESLWIAKSLILGMYDLAAVCVLFLVLAVRGFIKWGKKPL